MFADAILSDCQLRLVGGPGSGGFAIGLRLPWYRSLPLSCVEMVELRVDGDAVATECLSVSLGDVVCRVSNLLGRDDVWWFVRDSAELLVRRPDGLRPGAHEIEVGLGIRVPYFDPGPGAAWPVLRERSRRTLMSA